MKLYSSNDNYKLYEGSMLDMLEVIEPNTIDSIITDPPYGLTSITKRFGKEDSAECQYGKDGSFQRLSKGFMGKEWDGSGIEYNIDTWKKCYEVLKPESLNIGLAIDKKNGVDNRTGNIVQGMASNNTESLNNHKYETQNFKKEYEERVAQNKWQGWGTALKPSFEPIIVARKPFKGSLVDNVIEYGVGGINIDECRVGNEKLINKGMSSLGVMHDDNWVSNTEVVNEVTGRFPANTILTYDETDFDEVCGGFPNSKGASSQNNYSNGHIYRGQSMQESNTSLNGYREWYNDNGSASRYFYCAKASKKDRDEGCDTLNDGLLRRMRPDKDDSNPTGLNKEGRFAPVVRKNTHPTVKPTELMQYLVRLVTPNNGTVLDPFNGSGSTGKAVMYENKERNKNYKYIGIELTEEYLPIAKARIEYVCDLIEEEKTKDKQLSIFDVENN